MIDKDEIYKFIDRDVTIENYFDMVQRITSNVLNADTYYGSIVIGRYKVLMVDYKEFDNGGCVYIYKLKENGGQFGKTNVITGKQFYDNSLYKYAYEQGQEYIFVGFLESEVYKNKTTGEWINNGGIINITLGVRVNGGQVVK